MTSQHLCEVPKFQLFIYFYGQSQWPRGLRRRSAAARLLRMWVRIPPGAWISVCCECCVLSCRGVCDGLITRPEVSYRLWCVVVCDLETSSRLRRPWPALGCSAIGTKNIFIFFSIFFLFFVLFFFLWLWEVKTNHYTKKMYFPKNAFRHTKYIPLTPETCAVCVT